MMMETMYDPYDILFGDEQNSLPSEDVMFNDEIMLSDFNTDSSSISPITNTIDYSENNFDPKMFEDLVNQLISSDPSICDFPFEPEPPTREMGTDPMEPVPSTSSIIIKTTSTNPYINKPILVIRTTTTNPTMPIEYTSVTTDDYQMEDNLPLTPSSSSESPDEGNSNSPDSLQNTAYPSMLTDLDNLPTSGSLILTNEEIKIIKQEGYQVPTKLPLNKNEEKMLKKIRRKIKNKISAQESRRKKKEYVDALEKQIAQYIDENKALKDRMSKIEKNQKVIAQERDVLRSMIGKGVTTPAPSTALMVFAVFFAALFGVWAPTTNKSVHGDKSLAFMPSHNHQSIVPNHQSLFEQQDTTNSNNYKSRVLLSIDEYDNHHQHHGPYLPSNNKYKSTFQSQIAAPGYTYSNNVEKYMNKKLSNEQSNTNFKRSMTFTEEPAYKKLRSNYHINENIVVVEETTNEFDSELNESKPVKIIRVERTLPTIGNDTLKLAHRTMNE